MREIKFRAWDKDNEHMAYSDKHEWDYDFSFDGESGNLGCAINCCYCDTFGDEHDDWKELDKVMQYTGLHDENGKEIYEGDIIRDTENNIYVVDYDTKYAQFVLKEYDYVNNSGVLTQCDYNGLDYYYTIAEWGEVIGNIYENPELLGVGE